MSLYDDFDTPKHRTDKVAGWSSGIKLLQSQLQLKKAATPHAKREQNKKVAAVLAPVIDLKSKSRDNDKDDESKYYGNTSTPSGISNEFDWNVTNEYDPTWPNEYDKVVKELRDLRDREHDQEYEQRKRRRDTNPHFEENQMANIAANSNDRDEEEKRPTFRSNPTGAAIAPPPSLQEPSEPPPPPQPLPPPPRQTLNQGYATSSVAAKIMAKYGFKEGQGLGKKEQGMSVALQVEKTSKRGGRIVSEKEQLMPPPPLNLSPPSNSQVNSPAQGQDEPSITEIMKSPSKVVLLRNMVGPGEVDDDLEPEVKDECNTKYGDVNRVMIHEVMEAQPEDAVRIFVEFKRIESAIKAVVDLNGRFFGGRQVRAGFYSIEKLNNFQLLD